MSDSLIYKLALSKIPNVGTVLAKNLVNFCGGVEAVFCREVVYVKEDSGCRRENRPFGLLFQ